MENGEPNGTAGPGPIALPAEPSSAEPPAPVAPAQDAELAEADAGEESAGDPRASVGFIALEQLEDDETFRVRPSGELSALAMDLARLGQQRPIEVRPRDNGAFQLVCGFRRVEALKLLQRDQVLARVHASLADDDALAMALAEAIHSVPATREELAQVRARLVLEGRLSPIARDMIDKALAGPDELAPETVEEEGEGDGDDEVEVDADELAEDVTARLGELNQDLSLLADVFASLDRVRREELLQQLRYSSELVEFLEGK